MKSKAVWYALPWIIAAVLTVAIQILPKAFNWGFEEIVYSSGSHFVSEPTSMPTHEPFELVLNTSSKKIHISGCGYTNGMSDENKRTITVARDDIAAVIAELEQEGYSVCGICNKKISN